MQPKAGGKLHLRLNTGTRPIVDKYLRPEDSTRRARSAVPGPCGSPRGTAPRPDPSPAGRISSAAVRRDRLWVGLEGSEGKVARRSGVERYSPSATTSPLPPGPRETTAAAPSRRPPPSLVLPFTGVGRGGGGGHCSGRGPPPPTRLSTGSDCPQCAPDRVAPPGGDRPTHGRQGSAAMSATHPTRLETRTKESNARASQRASERNPVAQ
ncbi:hypothetical protein SKAU_G00212850 [Synaphobranchus kaupii]|uniref:Uncharacterized protein n=1 Tax=Synaphobranchus kaupii TaxID=118154 RepID=A0A9Q1IV75_SYNKA|nr:hypothetical protein SKAU_G00212850 [Synaphobranchus kaupii]